MDGIPVKISEKYKPPRKITLPASVQNKLNNEIKFEKYDFKLEHFVVEKMALLREQKKAVENKGNRDSPVTLNLEENVSQNNILKPVPILKSHVQNVSSNQQIVGGFNISDFENDTSSPFDSVELKTLNDMEELAHVLGGTQMNSRDKWSGLENGCNMQNWAWGATYSSPNMQYSLQPPPIKKNNDTGQKAIEKGNDTSLILKSLQQHVEEHKAFTAPPKKNIDNSGLSIAAGLSSSERHVEKKRETLHNPFPSLNSQSQGVARRIAEMGFPLSRAARATEMFGPNEGKVIEFMLEVQSLEESGYPGERAERALILCNYSRDEVVKFLDSAEQIMRLGFGEEEVISALVKSGFDRDKALDSLIS
uniref:Unkown protein n=1 Tax=Riptortus pedestris TaxID=329032 RepID=R4WDG2_RIPPE|nr:unkown protein [Riptortus pedestris]